MDIVINHSENIFLRQTRSNSYAFGIDDQGLVRHLYWGKRINEVEDFELSVLTEVSTNNPVYEITRRVRTRRRCGLIRAWHTALTPLCISVTAVRQKVQSSSATA